MLEKLKFYLGAIGSLILAALTFEFFRRGNKIDSLEKQVAGEQAARVGDKLEGELNEQEKQGEILKDALKVAGSKFTDARSKFDKLRSKLLGDSKDLSGDSGSGE